MKLKNYKSSGTDQMPAELIKAWVEIYSEIYKFICSTCNNDEMLEQWKEYIILPFHKKDDTTAKIIQESPSYKLPKNFYPLFF